MHRIIVKKVNCSSGKRGGIQLFIRFLALFTLVPIIELALLIKLGGYIGIVPTIVIVAGTGIIGVSLARSQGLELLAGLK
ncbi:MAG: FxsA family protein, partial [Halanaerobium sp.]|nr:FxsA family protein [Halanaerobium sp.]